MKIKLFSLVFCLSVFYFPLSYALQDLSGTYKCSGFDTKDGNFTLTHTMKLDKKNSTNKIAGYFIEVTEFQGGFKGFGTFDGKNLAIYFYSLDKTSKDGKSNYGVIIGAVSNSKISNVYYEPVYKGSSTGTSECVKISSKV